METKSGVFNKKKSVPSLVLTFNAANKFVNNAKDAVKDEDDETNSMSTHNNKGMLSVNSLIDNLETGSNFSYRYPSRAHH